ncbi:MAG TPA: pitrilysin family protein [Thermoanaerobaculia bacterium]|nr:pitrilysin family protein [Thermoanaerobaculia bacterium]
MSTMRRLPPPPQPPLPFLLPSFTGARLANGLELRAARWGRRPTVSVSVLFPGAGSAADPPGREGTAEITGETFLGGTRRRDARALAEAIDDLAVNLEVSAGSDSSVARLSILEKDLDAGLALLAEVLTESTFPEDEFEKNRRRQIDVLAEQRSEPDFLARERLLDRLYPGHPYGRLTATEKGLEALTRDSVALFATDRFALVGATLILAGAADPDVLLRAGARAFEGLPSGLGTPASPVPPPPRIDGFSIHLVHRPGSVQTNLLFARPALQRRSPRFTAAVVANQALGGGASSRLFHVLREERGLTYGAYSSLAARVAGGQFSASIDCRTEVTREACSGIFDLIRAFAAEGPGDEEHERARKYLLGSFPIPRETPGGIVQDEITRLLHRLPEDEWTTWRDRVGEVSRREACEVAMDFFDPATGILAAVGDSKLIRPVLESFGDTTLWDADGPRA